jgi:serine phosphatase RsbU (regulator of sigma subunit)
VDSAVLIRPCQGEYQSGDTAVVRELDDVVFLAMADVLGHGREAAEEARLIREFLEMHAARDVATLMHWLDRRLRGLRGAAAGLCAIDRKTGQLQYVGTGNTSLRRFGSSETRLISRDGVLGQNMRTPHAQHLQLKADDVVVLYTDGISDRFSVEDYPALVHQDAATIVRTIVNRFGKDHDDAACMALRYQE